MVDIHHSVFTSRKPNFACCKIIIETKFNFDLWEKLLVEYHDNIIGDFLKFRWPLNYVKDVLPHPPVRFHNPHSQYASFIDLYIKR